MVRKGGCRTDIAEGGVFNVCCYQAGRTVSVQLPTAIRCPVLAQHMAVSAYARATRCPVLTQRALLPARCFDYGPTRYHRSDLQ
eukprot:965434-Rhodomonas_salina.3